MDKTAMEELRENNTKVFTVFQYFDYSVATISQKTKYSKPNVKSYEINDSVVKYGALVQDYDTVDEQITAICARVMQDCIADIALVTIFQFFMPLDGYEKLKGMITNMSEEKLILELFKNNLFSGNIIVRKTMPVMVNKVTVNKLSS